MKRPIRSFFVVLSIVALALAPISSLVAQTTDMQALAAQAVSGAAHVKVGLNFPLLVGLGFPLSEPLIESNNTNS